MTASVLSTADVSVTETKRILFVDDDRSVLDGLRDALRPYRRQWTMSFVTNGEDALAALQATDHDVVVSDLRMPGLDGAALLERVRQQCPRWSGSCSRARRTSGWSLAPPPPRTG